MAHGLPDYYRGMRPRYGGMHSIEITKTVAGHSSTELAFAYGRGMLYSGYIFLDYSSTQKDSRPRLVIDDEVVSNISLGSMNSLKITHPRSAVVSLLIYDEINFIYSVGFSYGITFETNVKLVYVEEHGTTPKVYGKLAYALI